MYELKIRKHEDKKYLADAYGNIIIKNLRGDQIKDIEHYNEKLIKFLSSDLSVGSKPTDKDKIKSR